MNLRRHPHQPLSKGYRTRFALVGRLAWSGNSSLSGRGFTYWGTVLMESGWPPLGSAQRVGMQVLRRNISTDRPMGCFEHGILWHTGNHFQGCQRLYHDGQQIHYLYRTAYKGLQDLSASVFSAPFRFSFYVIFLTVKVCVSQCHV